MQYSNNIQVRYNYSLKYNANLLKTQWIIQRISTSRTFIWCLWITKTKYRMHKNNLIKFNKKWKYHRWRKKINQYWYRMSEYWYRIDIKWDLADVVSDKPKMNVGKNVLFIILQTACCLQFIVVWWCKLGRRD